MDTQALELRFYVHPHAADLPLPRYSLERPDGGIELRHAGPATEVAPGETILADTGLRLAIPQGWVGLIRSRGGIYARYGITARHETITSDFRDDLKVTLRLAPGAPKMLIPRGDRIAQLILVPAHQAKLCELSFEEFSAMVLGTPARAA